MFSMGPWQLLIILAIILLLFGGRGRIPQLMKDMGTGINAFRKGLKEEDKDKDGDAKTETLEAKSDAPAARSNENETDKSA
jgi:sec-independent protein translocase protein TatA